MLLTETTIQAQNGKKKSAAIVVTVAVFIVIAIVCGLVSMIPAMRDEPQIVAAVIGPVAEEQPKMKKKTVMKQVKQTSAASAASPIAKMMRAATTAEIATPEVTKVSDSPLGFGEGDFGDGFGAGDGSGGMGSGATFFGSTTQGRRFLFVLDGSGSMKDNQVRLRNAETEKALKALPSTAEYQVLIFAGACLYAEPGWSVASVGRTEQTVTNPEGKKVVFNGKGAHDWTPIGGDKNLPRAEWKRASQSNISETIDFMEDLKLFYGTDWVLALETAHLMKPQPDVIFFMSDGGSGPNPARGVLAANRKGGKPKIQCFAMQTGDGAKDFMEIAQGTKGEFVIVERGGKTIPGAEYLKNPGKFRLD